MDHLALAHDLWKQHLQAGDIAIDATCGRGHDTLFLAELPINQLIAIDIQQEAIDSTRSYIAERNPALLEKIVFIHGSHSSFPAEIPKASVALIVYNLGYLPKGDKTKTTMTETTLQSLKNAELILKPNGIISLTLYPGHTEGLRETESLLKYTELLDRNIWQVTLHENNARPLRPKLLLLKRKI